MKHRLLLLAPFLLLTACQEEPAPPPPVRPVLSMVVASQPEQSPRYVGTVQPRYSRDLGFRILGRMVTRNVNIGDQVKKGELLATLDPTALALSVRQLEADLASAEATSTNADATLKRQRSLMSSRVSSQSDVDTAVQAQASAASSVVRAKAALDKAKEELSYARLTSDNDGIVTAVGAEIGQTVTAGQTIVTIAQPDQREAVVDIPDAVAGRVRAGDAFDVTLQIDPSVKTTGTVREIAPEADAATRSRRVRISLDNPPDLFRLGTTVAARLGGKDIASIDLPKSALLQDDGKTYVWLVDSKAKTVSRHPVEIGDVSDEVFRIKGGIKIGDRVVTAGVHSLEDGQAVKIDPEIVP